MGYLYKGKKEALCNALVIPVNYEMTVMVLMNVQNISDGRKGMDNGFNKACPSGNSLVDAVDLQKLFEEREVEEAYWDYLVDLLED